MGMVVRAIFKLYSVFLFALALQQSTGLTSISPSPAASLGLGPSSGHTNEEPFTTNPPSPIGSLAPPPFFSPPEPPETDNGLAPSLPPSVIATEVPPVSDPLGNVPAVSPTLPPIATPIDLGPPPSEVVVHAPSPSQGNETVVEPPILMPVAPVVTPSSAPVASPRSNQPQLSSPTMAPEAKPKTPPVSIASPSSAPVASPPSNQPQHSSPTMAPEAKPKTPPVSIASPPPTELGSNPPVPAVSSPTQPPRISPFNHSPSMLPSSGHSVSPLSSLPPVFNWGNEGAPAVAPSTSRIPAKNGSSHISPAPSNLLPKSQTNGHPPGLSPSTSIKKPYNPSNKPTSPAPAPSLPVSPPILNHHEPAGPPLPIRVYPHPGLPPLPSDSPISSPPAPVFLPLSHDSPSPSPSQKGLTGNNRRVFPSMPPSESPNALLKPPLRAFPPPPPNQDCSTIVCTEPYTNTPPGAPCACVLPIQVGLRLSVALYTFFPLVSELAQEISAGDFVRQSQVRIIGATAANQQPDKTIVLVDLVPLGEKFDSTFSFLTYKRFWNKQVTIEKAYFGDYEVLYVRYPGLPESPPSRIGIIDDGPYPGANNNGRKIKPLGVDVPKNQHRNRLSGGVIAIIVLSASLAVIFCGTAAWIFLVKRKDNDGSRTRSNPHVFLPALSKRSGFPGSVLGSRDSQSSATLSFGSSIATYTGSARTFAASDMEKATDHFNASRVLGEGGFGRVYSGVLEDGTKVAVKVLKRDDQQGGREFLAEVEMLSRLHHRNLVKLIGICMEERGRCLVYELIPNGSVESHLHGVDKESSPLNWGARMKIALGSARGLAYLHEDSSPRVIHRDFKASNILLEDDFMPKVSDFGLARAALEEENRHISTRVMGTFGYVAPEYAMTGHLLVKSDVYSYGVVLLELLTGRKPVDMSQPPGEENLVAWARPLLASKESLQTIVDQSLGSDLPYDNVAKVAAIASMCVQPEVTNRPFMGEVVQALKLVCNEIEEANGLGSRASSRRDDLSIDMGLSSDKFLDPTERSQYSSVHSYGSDDLNSRGGLSVSELFTGSARVGTEQSESFRRHSSSGPLGGQQTKPFWDRVRRYSGGSVSEYGVAFRVWPGSH